MDTPFSAHDDDNALSAEDMATLMQGDGAAEELFVSEYTYSDDDTQYERRRSLERHSSTDVTDIPIVKLIESQRAQEERDSSAKPIVAYMQSLFRATGTTTSRLGTSISWLSGSHKKDERKLSIQNLLNLTEPSDAVDALEWATELKDANYTRAVLDLITHLCEQDTSKSVSASLAELGASSAVDRLFAMHVPADAPVTEAALRAICSLITPPPSSSHRSYRTNANASSGNSPGGTGAREGDIRGGASSGTSSSMNAPSASSSGTGINISANTSSYSISQGILGVGSQESSFIEYGISKSRQAFSSAAAVYRIIKASTTHMEDEIILEWGVRVLFYLSLEKGLVSRIISCGGCDLLAQSLRMHSGCDDIVVWSCRTLCHCILTLEVVSENEREICQDKFAQQYVLEILISEFAERLATVGELAAQWSLKAIGALARKHEKNKCTLIELGVCELLQNVREHYSLDGSEKLAEGVCWVIGNVSYPSEEAQLRWGACGACSVVITTLHQNMHSEETIQEALRALRNVAYEHEENLEQLRQLGVGAVMMQVLRRYRESSGVVLQWLWYTVAALAEYRPIVLQLGEQDVSRALVDSLNRFSSRPDLVQWAALAVTNLAADPVVSAQLGQAKCCAVLTQSLSEHRNESDVVEEILTAVAALCENCFSNRLKFLQARVEIPLILVLGLYEKKITSAEASASATPSSSNSSSSSSTGLLAVSVVEAGLAAVSSLVSRSVRAAEKGGQNGDGDKRGPIPTHDSIGGASQGSTNSSKDDKDDETSSGGKMDNSTHPLIPAAAAAAADTAPPDRDTQHQQQKEADSVTRKVILALMKADSGGKVLARSILKLASNPLAARVGGSIFADMSLFGIPESHRWYMTNVIHNGGGGGGDLQQGNQPHAFSSTTARAADAAVALGRAAGDDASCWDSSQMPYANRTLSVEFLAQRYQQQMSAGADEKTIAATNTTGGDILERLGSAGAPAALAEALRHQYADAEIALQLLTALDRVGYTMTNIPLLQQAGVESLLVRVLQFHFTTQPCIVRLCYRMYVHMCASMVSQEALGRSLGAETLLVTLAHHMTAPLSAVLGCHAISALIISPHSDAIATIAAKDTAPYQHDDIAAHSSSGSGGSGGSHSPSTRSPSAGYSFDSNLQLHSQTPSWDGEMTPPVDGASASASASTLPRALTSLLSWTGGDSSDSSGNNGSANTGHANNSNSNNNNNNNNDAAGSFEFRGNRASSNGSTSGAAALLEFAAGGFISKGLTDQEEEMHMLRALEKTQKSNSSILITNGVTTILLTILQQQQQGLRKQEEEEEEEEVTAKMAPTSATSTGDVAGVIYGGSDAVRMAVVNVVNSLALETNYRSELNHEGLFEVLAEVYESSLMETRNHQKTISRPQVMPTTSSNAAAPAANAASLAISVPEFVEASSQGSKNAPNPPAGGKEDAQKHTDAARQKEKKKHRLQKELVAAMSSKRMVLVTLNLALGSLCLPLPDEIEGLTSTASGIGPTTATAIATGAVATAAAAAAGESNHSNSSSSSGMSNMDKIGSSGRNNIGSIVDTSEDPHSQDSSSSASSGAPTTISQLDNEQASAAAIASIAASATNPTPPAHLQQEEIPLFASQNQHQLGKLNFCELLVHCLDHYAEDVLVCESVLRAIFYLARDNASNQWRFAEVRAVPLIMSTLRRYMGSTHIVYYSCQCMAGLCMYNSRNVDMFDELGVGQVLRKIFRAYIDSVEVLSAACYAVYALKALNHKLFDVCQLVVDTLKQHPDSSSVCHFACRAIASLAELPRNKQELERHGVCAVVPAVLLRNVTSNHLLSAAMSLIMPVTAANASSSSSYSAAGGGGGDSDYTAGGGSSSFVMGSDGSGGTSSEGGNAAAGGGTSSSAAAVVHWACTAIYYLARGNEAQLIQQKLVAAGACEGVTKTLIKYPEVETISHACLRCLVVLLMNNGAYKSKLGALGVCACVVEAMHMFPYSVQVSKWGCRAVAVLAESHEANIARLGVAGACESIPVVLQAHPSNEFVASAGCDVISFMSETASNGHAARFGVSGACEAVVSVLRKHSANTYVVTRASIALGTLARVKGNATWFGPAGACDALMAVLQLHREDLVASKFIISAVGNLCVVDHNRERLGALGACEYVVACASRHHLDLDTAKASALAMGKLCEHIHKPLAPEESITHSASVGETAMGDDRNQSLNDTRINHNNKIASRNINNDSSGGVLNSSNSPPAATASGSGEGRISQQQTAVFPTSTSSALLSALGGSFEQGEVGTAEEAVDVMEDEYEDSLPYRSSNNSNSSIAVERNSYASPSQALPMNARSPMATTVPIGTPPPPPPPPPSTGTTTTASMNNTSAHYAAPATPLSVSKMSPVAQAHSLAGRRNRARLFDADFCTVLMKLLTCHITDTDATRIISRTVSIVAFGDACKAERDCLAAVGACSVFAKALQFHEGNEFISRSVCWAIKALAYHHHRNREVFRKLGIRQSVVVVLRGYRFSATAIETVQAAAAAIANLCQDNLGNKATIGAAGACEGLLEVMELHYRNIEVAYLASKALFHLCDGNHENRLKISFSGAADILMLMVARYADEDRILDYLFSIMIGMCTGKVGQSRLGTVGACKAVVSALYRYEKSSEYIVLLCSTLIHSLARNSVDNQAKLGAAGACKAVSVAASRYVRSKTFHSVNAAPRHPMPRVMTEEEFGVELRMMKSASHLSLNSEGSQGSSSSISSRSTTPLTMMPTAETSATPAVAAASPNATNASFTMQTPDNNDNNNNNKSDNAAAVVAGDTTTTTTTTTTQQQSMNAEELHLTSLRPQYPLTEIVGEYSVLKESCRAIVCLCSNTASSSNNPSTGSASVMSENRSKFHLTTVLDTLTAVLSGASSSVEGSTSGTFTPETMKWAKTALDCLVGR